MLNNLIRCPIPARMAKREVGADIEPRNETKNAFGSGH